MPNLKTDIVDFFDKRYVKRNMINIRNCMKIISYRHKQPLLIIILKDDESFKWVHFGKKKATEYIVESLLIK